MLCLAKELVTDRSNPVKAVTNCKVPLPRLTMQLLLPLCFALLTDSDDSHDEIEKCDPHYKPLWARFWALFVCLSLGVTAASDPALWAIATETFSVERAALEAQYKALPRCGEPSRVRRFMQRWLSKWEQGNFTCADELRIGRKRLLSVEEAQKAADLIKKGKWIKVKVRNKVQHRLVYYTSIQDAIDNCPEVADICTRNNITAEQLREAMHYVDPDLVRKRITFKRRLSKEEKADRVQTAEAMLQRLSEDPSMLERMVFIDETSVVLLGDNHDHVHAWCDKHDVNFHDVCPLPAVSTSNPLKVHLIAAVSAHPAFAATKGLVYVEVTTGTTYIKRRHNRRLDGSTKVSDYNYQVRCTAGVYLGFNTCTPCSTVASDNQGVFRPPARCSAATYSTLSPLHSILQLAKLRVSAMAAPPAAAAKAAMMQLGSCRSASWMRTSDVRALTTAAFSLISRAAMSDLLYWCMPVQWCLPSTCT